MLPSICGNTYSLEEMLSVVCPYYMLCAIWQKKLSFFLCIAEAD